MIYALFYFKSHLDPREITFLLNDGNAIGDLGS